MRQSWNPSWRPWRLPEKWFGLSIVIRCMEDLNGFDELKIFGSFLHSVKHSSCPNETLLCISRNMKRRIFAEKLSQSSLIVAQHTQKSPAADPFVRWDVILVLNGARKMRWDAESRQGQYQACLVGRLAGSRGLYPLFAQICRPQQTPHDLNMSFVARGLLLVCFFGRAIWQWKRENFDMLSKSTAMCWPRYLFGTQCGILDFK